MPIEDFMQILTKLIDLFDAGAISTDQVEKRFDDAWEFYKESKRKS